MGHAASAAWDAVGTSSTDTTTAALAAMRAGDAGAAQKLWAKVYDDLHAVAASALRAERFGHTLQPTALVNEAYLRLAEQTRVEWKSREHFFAIAAQVIRRILVDHARERNALKRGRGAERLELEDVDGAAAPNPGEGIDLVGLDEALSSLAALNERQARVVELRFFAGLGVPEVAKVLEVSERTVKSEWRFAKAWLRRFLKELEA